MLVGIDKHPSNAIPTLYRVHIRTDDPMVMLCTYLHSPPSYISHGERLYFYGLPKVIEGQVIVQKFSRNKFQTVTFKKRTEELVALLKSQERQRFKSI